MKLNLHLLYTFLKNVVVGLLRLRNNVLYSHRPPRIMMPAHACASLTHAAYEVIENGHTVQRFEPIHVDRRLHWKFADELVRDLPRSFVTELSDARIVGGGGVIVNDDWFVSDVYKEMGVEPAKSKVVVRGNFPKPQKINAAVLIAATNSSLSNYFHFLFDSLPRIALAAGHEWDYVYIANTRGYQKQYLDLLGISTDQVINAEPRSHVLADRAVIPSWPGSTGNPSKSTAKYLRSIKTRLLGDNATSSNSPSRKVDITRSDAKSRRVLNEESVIHFLESRSFEVHTLEGLSVTEQIALLDSAEVVVAPHGAGLSNIVFCNEDCKIIEFFSPRYVNVCYWALADMCELQYGYLLGVGNILDASRYPSDKGADITLDINQLADLFEEMNIR